jgi:hypothetical protein
MLGRLIAKEEAGPSPIRASRVWAQDDNLKQRQGREGGGEKKQRREGQREKYTALILEAQGADFVQEGFVGDA